MATAPKTGLDDFFDNLKQVRKLALVAAGGLLAVPLAVGLAGFSPPWPPGLTVMTSLAELVILVVVFQLLARAPRAKADKVILWSAVLVFVFSAFYLFLNAAFVYQIPNNDTRVVLGCGLSDNARLILKNEGQNPTDVCPGEFAQLLSASQYNTDKIWTRLSVTVVQVLLVGTWLGAFGAFAAMVGVFVSFQKRQPSQLPPQGPAKGGAKAKSRPKAASPATTPEASSKPASGTATKSDPASQPAPDAGT